MNDTEYKAVLGEGLRLWNEHRFFECHDKLEEAWKLVKHEKKAEPALDPRRDFTHGIILLAVAFHHWRNGNAVGALRKYDEARKLLRPYPARFQGVHVAALKAQAQALFEALRAAPSQPFPAASVPRLPGAAANG